MLGFENLSSEVGVAPDAPPPAWEMKFLSEAALKGGSAHGGSVVPPARAVNSFPAAPPATRSFQRNSIIQSAESSTFSNEGTLKTQEVADLNQTSANSFIVQGSMSSAAGIGAQNDWGPPPGGPGMMGMMGPGGAGAPGGQGPDGMQRATGQGVR